MNNDAKLPEADRDLARRIGEGLERGSLDDAQQGGDRFFDALLALKRQAETDREAPSRDASRRMWMHIDAASRPRRDRPAFRRVDRRTPRRVWAVAAALLIGAFVAVLTLRGPDEVLVASAGSETIAYTTPDGSVVTLRPHSELYVMEANVRYRLAGEAFFEVTARDDRPFAVEGGEAVVEVLGTRFNLSTWGAGASVYLEEGRIRFAYVPTGDEVVLEPGQASRLTAGGGVLDPAAEPAGEHLDWLDGMMQFEQRPVQRVAAELARHFGLDVEIPELILDETLSGSIPLDDAEQSLDDLGRVMGGRFVSTGPNSYRFEPE